MNDYITLDGKKYKTPAKTWQPVDNKIATARITLQGALDVTYGPASLREWHGEIEAAVTPQAGFGSITDLLTSLAKRQILSFTDHYGTAYSVDVSGQMARRSMTPKWDGYSNKWYVQVAIRTTA